MTVLELKNQKWIAKYYKIVINRPDTFYSETPMEFISKPDSLYKLLLSNNINNLPSDDSLYNNLNYHKTNGFIVPILPPDDGGTYYVETNNNNNYTVYNYSNPITMQNIFLSYSKDYNINNNIDELNKFVNILKILEKEFSTYRTSKMPPLLRR